MTNKIFVFGSNLAGRHGKGAAKYALKHHGAKYGEGVGHFGNSFAIPTKDYQIRTLPLRRIKQFVDMFLYYAEHNPQLEFYLTPIGCGLAGYKPEDIAPMFKNSPSNVELPEEFKKVLNEKQF
ncbi:hypothetical protein [Pseudomonas phage K4]|uniref:hypothetical protein n=1 Tax=Pseudomonas phage O4 TaxID=1784982 RepID=UPI00078B6E93|nr:hypothetical protein BJD45_gp34 [Pseudomonas phage O4]AMO43509.1 hypothetical protein O4_34 [Pseudomonas phage O4]ATG86269.1 hypothetical protein [Pseudomonas phage IME180]QWS69994.1 hypothetical protein [Pseudomonas phage K4]